MESPPTDFIRQRIQSDIAEQRLSQGVITRFPPEPNGYLHIGHAKSICLNFGVAEQFGGKTYLRFDDTNPLKESDEYVEAIKADVQWLGFEWTEVTHASDYFEEIYNYAVELIKADKAFVCSLDAEAMRSTRGSLTELDKTALIEAGPLKKIWICFSACVTVNLPRRTCVAAEDRYGVAEH